jgi:hypothetical protein
LPVDPEVASDAKATHEKDEVRRRSMFKNASRFIMAGIGRMCMMSVAVVSTALLFAQGG